jgi:flagellar basal body-associated protein FliL
MINKKLLIAVVVIVLVAIVGIFLFVRSHGSTGAVTGVPGENNSNTAEETQTDASKFSEIKEDMTEDAVITLVGTPYDKQTVKTPRGNIIEYWYYTDNNNDVWQIGFSSGTVSVVRKY